MNAKERFEATREAVPRLNDVHLLLMNDCEDWKPPGIKSKTDKSDPTANKAIYNVDELGEKLAALRKEEAELTEFIGTSLAIISSVSAGLGNTYANLLEWRYIDNWKWERIEKDCGIAKSSGHYLLDIAFDWIDSVGVSRLLKGEVEV